MRALYDFNAVAGACHLPIGQCRITSVI